MPLFGVGGGNPYYLNFGDTAVEELTLPTGVTAVPDQARPRPCFARWNGDLFVAGYFTRVMRFTANYEFIPSGIFAPPKMPVLAAGASSGGSTGINIGYVTFRQERVNGEIVHESNPTGPTATISVTGEGFAWSNLATASVDPRVTHVVGYRSVDGAIPREAWKREIAAAVSSLTENTLTGGLGVELPNSEGVDGAVELEPEARGVVPYCRLAVPFHNSMIYAGFPDKPYVIAPSRIFEPESVDLSDTSPTAQVTLGREAVIGMIEHEATERLLIFCSNKKVYALTGYGPDDYDISPVNGFYELLSHDGLRHMGPDSDVVLPSQEGPVRFNGSFRELMPQRSHEWKQLLRDYPDEMARCWAVESNEVRTMGYKVNVPIPDPEDATRLSYYFYGHYDEVPKGGEAEWTNDARTREDTCAAVVRPYGRPGEEVWTGSADGYIRKEDVAADADDDDDDYQKRFDLTMAHQWLPSQAGDAQHAARIATVDVYMKNESEDGTLELYPGDDSAAEGVEGFKTIEIPAGALPASKRQKVPVTSRRFGAGGIASGKGVAARVYVDAPTVVEWRGLSYQYEEGSEQARLFSDEG